MVLAFGVHGRRRHVFRRQEALGGVLVAHRHGMPVDSFRLANWHIWLYPWFYRLHRRLHQKCQTVEGRHLGFVAELADAPGLGPGSTE